MVADFHLQKGSPLSPNTFILYSNALRSVRESVWAACLHWNGFSTSPHLVRLSFFDWFWRVGVFLQMCRLDTGNIFSDCLYNQNIITLNRIIWGVVSNYLVICYLVIWEFWFQSICCRSRQVWEIFIWFWSYSCLNLKLGSLLD